MIDKELVTDLLHDSFYMEKPKLTKEEVDKRLKKIEDEWKNINNLKIGDTIQIRHNRMRPIMHCAGCACKCDDEDKWND